METRQEIKDVSRSGANYTPDDIAQVLSTKKYDADERGVLAKEVCSFLVEAYISATNPNPTEILRATQVVGTLFQYAANREGMGLDADEVFKVSDVDPYAEGVKLALEQFTDTELAQQARQLLDRDRKFFSWWFLILPLLTQNH